MKKELQDRLRWNRKRALALLLLLSGNFLLFFTIWLFGKYDQPYVDQLIFQLKSSSEGAQTALINSAAIRVGLFGIVLTVIETFAYVFLTGGHRFSFFKNQAMLLAVISLLFSAVLFATSLQLFPYIETTAMESDFIEEHYADPDQVSLQFPARRRNLIYIFLESMENTFSTMNAGEPITDNYIDELSALANGNINFSNTPGMGGAYSYPGTTWTAAAMATQTCGLPVKMEVGADEDAYGAGEDFLPGAISLGEILEQQGYRQLLLVGSDAEFHGRKEYFTQHGNYEIVDTVSLKEQNRLPEDYAVWWGFEDQKLFAFAKEELTRLAESGEPFNFTMLTADTHFPDGYECPLCGDAYNEQYANVLACSSRQIYDFIHWIEEQPFYENTTIVTSGDHLTMDADFLDDMDENYTRTIYNCIINAPIEPVQEKERQFGTFDMFPTTLAAMGVKIEGDRLGLGTNLFSTEQTLTEQYGYERLTEEIQKNSEFYNRKILEMEE